VFKQATSTRSTLLAALALAAPALATLARLSSAGRRLLERRHRLHLTTIVQADPSGGGSGYGRALTLTLGRR